jgi:aminobenzoyl-glutamate utilization protein B
MKTKQDVIEWLEQNRQQFIDMAHAIWEKPELAFKEFFAADLQADFLEKEGFRVTRDVAGSQHRLHCRVGRGPAHPGLCRRV